MMTEFERLKSDGKLDAAAAELLAEAAVSSILSAWQAKLEPSREAITTLCELATAEEEAVQRIGTHALFARVIEPLNDSFSHAGCALYDQLFAQVITFCRALPAAIEFDEMLNRFGLRQEEDFLVRKARLLRVPRYQVGGPVRKIVLFSRVTLGADVAINGVLIAALRTRFPQAEIVLFGSRKLHELFGGDARVRVRELKYERGGGLLARLTAWLAVVAALAEEGRQCWQEDPQSEMLVVDPDSRLTQLGLLPVVLDDRNYFFFESRTYENLSAAPLSQLTATWAYEVFGTLANLTPTLALPQKYAVFGRALRECFCGVEDWLVTVSWGVGGNARKRLDAAFETELLLKLLDGARVSARGEEIHGAELPACKVVLDKGGDEIERAQTNQLLEQLRAQGKQVVELNEANVSATFTRGRFAADVVAWEGGIGSLAGLIAASNAYVGYDSAGQHLAGALGTPTVTLFVNGNVPLFAARWRPAGLGKLAVVNLQADDWEKGNLLADRLMQQTLAGLYAVGLQKKK
jgi:hypothetical protein